MSLAVIDVAQGIAAIDIRQQRAYIPILMLSIFHIIVYLNINISLLQLKPIVLCFAAVIAIVHGISIEIDLKFMLG